MLRTIRAAAIALGLCLSACTPHLASAITISDVTPWASYVAASSQTTFPFAWPVLDDDDLAVYKNAALLVKTADYSISGIGAQAGGNVVLSVGANAGDIIVIAGALPLQRKSQYGIDRAFSAAQLNEDLNTLVQQIQQVEMLALRCPSRDVEDWGGVREVLPDPDVTKVLGWSGAGKLTNVDPAVVGSSDCASCLNAVIPGGTRTVATMQDYLANGAVHNVLDYGAVAGDASNDADSIQLALTTANSTGGGIVWVADPGVYQLDAQLEIDDNVALVCTEGAILRRNWDGVVGEKPDNATIKNADAPAAADLLVDPGPYVHPTINSGIRIIGCTFDISSDAMEGSHVALYGVTDIALHDLRFRGVSQDWNVALWGDYMRVTGLDIDSGDEVLEDGIHVIGGSHVRIADSRIKCGDDAIALISNLNLGLSDVTVENITVESREGHAITLGTARDGATAAFGQPTEPYQRIAITNVVGQAGICKNGLIRVNQTGVTDKTLTRDVTIADVDLVHGSLSSTCGSSPRNGTSGSQDYGVRMDGGLRFTFDNVTIREPIRDGWSLVDVDTVRITNSNCLDPQETSTGRSCVDTDTGADHLTITGNYFSHGDHHVVHLTDAADVVVANNQIVDIGNTLSGILLDGSTGTTDVAITDNLFHQAASATGVRVNSAGVNNVSITGNNFTNVASPLTLTNTPSVFRFAGNTSEESAAVASAATLQMPDTHDVVLVTGAADVTTLATGWPGRQVTLRFSGTAATTGIVDGGNLNLLSDFNYSPGAVIALAWTGGEWLEVSRKGSGICRAIYGARGNPTEAQGTDDYMNLVAGTMSTTEADEDVLKVGARVTCFDHIACEVDVAPGSGDQWTVTLRDDGASTALNCDIVDTNTTCTDGDAKVCPAAGSRLNLLASSADGASNPDAAASLHCGICVVD